MQLLMGTIEKGKLTHKKVTRVYLKPKKIMIFTESLL